MLVLGISPLDKDSTVSIVSDGKVLFAAGEERFTRVKLQDGFPYKSLEAALKYLGISSRDIDIVAYPFFEWPHEARLISKNIEDEAAFIRASRMDSWSKGVKQSLGSVPMGRMEVPGLQSPHERNRKSVLHESFYRLVAQGISSLALWRCMHPNRGKKRPSSVTSTGKTNLRRG
jgi:carbamoyltransferase